MFLKAARQKFITKDVFRFLQIQVHVNIYNINKINIYILPDGEGIWPRPFKKKLSLCSQSLTFPSVVQDAQQPSLHHSTKMLTPVTSTIIKTKKNVTQINMFSASPAKQVVSSYLPEVW